MSKLTIVIGTFLLLLAPLSAQAETNAAPVKAPSEQPGADAAISAAQSWLKVVDSGQFEKSWEEAAPIFQSNVAEDSWSKMLTTHREPLGQVKARELRSKTFFTSLPGAPEGRYWVLDFVATFDGDKKLYERVTPMKVGESDWRVSGYFLNPTGFSN